MLAAKNPAVIRLGRAAESGQTGVLHLSGESSGAIYLSQGMVVYAESRRTPDLAARLERAAEFARRGAVGSLERSWVAREATVDAAAELLSGKPRHARFRAAEQLGLPGSANSADMAGMPVADLWNEVSRRQEIITQLSAVLTPDTAVTRNPRLRSRAVRVSDMQWAILMRARDPVTPRGLALELGQSVFGLTIAIFRLVTAGLLSAGSAEPAAETGQLNRDRPAISFTRALAR